MYTACTLMICKHHSQKGDVIYYCIAMIDFKIIWKVSALAM